MSERLDPQVPNPWRGPEAGQKPLVPSGPSASTGPTGPKPPTAAWSDGSRTPSSNPRGLAVAALVVAILALLLAAVPLVNVVSIVGGVVAVVLGVVAIVGARRGTSGGRGLSIAGVAVGSAALVIALVVDTVVGVTYVRGHEGRPTRSAGASSGQPRDEPAPTPSGPASGSPTDGTSLALGKSATVGDYSVAVTTVDTDANAVIASTNQFNDPPSGQYVLVDVSVVYHGSADGRAWLDLHVEYQGTDARNYRQCPAVIPRAGSAQPDLRAGGRADYQVCFDVPPTAIAGGRVSVSPSDTVGEGGDEAYWTVPATSGQASGSSSNSAGV